MDVEIASGFFYSSIYATGAYRYTYLIITKPATAFQKRQPIKRAYRPIITTSPALRFGIMLVGIQDTGRA